MLFTKSKFKGGIHPKDHKKISRGLDIAQIPAGEEVIIPLSQHIGAPCAPAVQNGDTVKQGDIIGTPSGFISAIIHSSVSGTVKEIALRPHPLGKKVLSVVITVKEDAPDTEFKKPKNQDDVDKLKPKDIIDFVQRAGIVGMGGASFPTHVKLSPPKGKTIDTLIINSAECEPYLTADETLLRNHAEQIIQGTKLLQKAVQAKKAVIGIEDNKPEAIKILKDKLKESGIALAVLPTRYPQGGEKQLIQAVLEREVPSGGLPMDAGALVQNTATANAVYEAVYLEKPLFERITTITGHGIKKPGNYRTRIGMKLKTLLEQAGFEEKDSSLVIMGGPMMGLPVLDLETPVIKSTSGILVIDELQLKKEFPCIRCGRCIDYCPISLSPTEIASAYNRNDPELFGKLNAMDCIECGCCAYICPSGIPLVQYLKLSKIQIRKNAGKK